MKRTRYLKSNTIKLFLVIISCLVLAIFSSTAHASTPSKNLATLTASDLSLIKSLLPQKNISNVDRHLSSKQVQMGTQYIIDRGNSAKIQAALKRSDISSQVRNIILSIPTQTKWAIYQEPSFQKGIVSSHSCQYADTAHGYIQDTDIYGIVLWSYDVKQPFNIDGSNVCSFGARNPTFYANGYASWKNGGETWSRGDAPSSAVTEISKGFFNPGYGLIQGEVGRITLFMYGGGYWDVSVGIE